MARFELSDDVTLTQAVLVTAETEQTSATVLSSGQRCGIVKLHDLDHGIA